MTGAWMEQNRGMDDRGLDRRSDYVRDTMGM